MKITYNWLKKYVDFAWDWPELVERLTMAGLEFEGVEDLGARYEGVVIGRVNTCCPHENADRLTVCQVDVGTGVNTIVCGAPNVAAGQTVAVALPGTTLPGGMQIKKAKIRGVASEGMLCAEDELGLGDNHDGIVVLDEGLSVGTPFAAATGLGDVVIDFEVTPNRPDCLSLLGIAREVHALTGNPLRFPNVQVTESGPATAEDVRIDIEAPDDCPRYVGRIVRGVEVGPSPEWLQRRLQAVGQRPINNIVDITNYVLLELGHPLHAFDLHTLDQRRIVVRRARAGETLEMLDSTQCQLDEEMLVIADGTRPQALAGVMGGAHSQVSADTTDILLESAYFAPSRVRLARSQLGLFTEAATRFERGADWDAPVQAIDRAAYLIAKLTGGAVAPIPLDVYPRPGQCYQIPLCVERTNQLLATELDSAAIAQILERLGCRVESGRPLVVTAPSFRPDLTRPADLIEEVGRIYGFDRIEGRQEASGPWITQRNPELTFRQVARQRLLGLGLDEVVSNTIVESRWLKLVGTADRAARLANPPTETQDALRTALVPSLLDVARRNFNQRAAGVAIFELGKCFVAAAAKGVRPEENWHLAALWSGRVSASPYQADTREADFFDLKGLLEALVGEGDLRFAPADRPECRSGHAACISLGGEPLGWLGQASTDLCVAFDLERQVHIFEISFTALVRHWHGRERSFTALPKFPPIERDLAIVVRADTATAELIATMRDSAPHLVESIEVFDLYQGDQIEAGHKSVAFAIRLRDREQTLQDAQADAAISAMLKSLEVRFGARLR
ncbi:MAG: phenylalanine--tRNA ligase subunit beta [Gemmatimonadota bacterium]|nr:phenylalanine--tRNA ligase subunit beta [Gemmatimonadota bacterium]